MFSYFRFRYHRALRRGRRNFRVWNRWALHYLQRHIYGAWHKLLRLGWQFYVVCALLLLGFIGGITQWRGLDTFYLVKKPISGGYYSEGLVGDVKILNPLLTDSNASTDINKLIFSGLTQFDGKGQSVADIAKSWTTSADYRTYTFELRPDVYWHDGVALTAEDVAFTIGLIQNPDTGAAQAENWKGVKTDVLNAHSVRFTLPASYPSFLSVTNVGILPKHILNGTNPQNMRLASFNQKPIGSGPFSFDTMTANGIVTLKRNDRYYGGKPLLDGVKFYLYHDSSQLTDGYAKKQIMGFGGIQPSQLATVRKLPQIVIRAINQPSYVALFFNTQSPSLGTNNLRQAVAAGINRPAIIGMSDGVAQQATSQTLPLFTNQLGIDYASKIHFDPGFAKSSLSQATAGKRITLNLVTVNSPEFVAMAHTIQTQLSSVGIDLTITAVDVNTLEQNYIRPRTYDMILLGENIGADPDVYNFWHSSQVNDPGLNLSLYKSPTADKYLESARLSHDPVNRKAKQVSFIQTWDNDTPAVILYSPYYLYAQSTSVSPSQLSWLISPSDRFYNIQTWAVRYEQVSRAQMRN